MRSISACLLCFFLGVSSRAAAQADQPGASPSGGVPPTRPASAPPRPTDATLDHIQNGVPNVSDPMLDPIELPAQVLGSWQQALALMRSRSTSIATARAQIAEADARSRQTLSSSLPTLSGNGSVTRNLLFATGTTTLTQGGVAEVRLPYPATTWNAGVSFRQPVFDLRSWYDGVALVPELDTPEYSGTVVWDSFEISLTKTN